MNPIEAPKKKKGGGFETFGFTSAVYNGIKRKGFRVPTPIQRRVIPSIIEGRDICAMARTGSGKTAAFLLPMFEKLRMHSATSGGPRAIIVAPTRELVIQTVSFIKQLSRFLDLRTAVLIGGESMVRDYEALSAQPDLIVCTPGRIIHHMNEIPEFTLSHVEILVLDEADRLFELGLSDQVREIMDATPDNRQTLMFSATMPKLLADFTKAGMRDPQLIRLDAEDRLSQDLQTAFFNVKPHEKAAALLYLLQEVIPADQQTMVFVATRHHVEYYCEMLKISGFSVVMAYGSMDQTARKIALESFRARRAMVMVVTDVAARGLDVPLLDNVINADFPASSKLFIHRVGRVARAGRAGTAYSFVSMEELAFMVELHLFLGRDLSDMGTFPTSITDSYNEIVVAIHHKSTDLDTMLKVVHNAEKAYKRTRAKASSESVRRAKEIMANAIPIHPLIVDKGAVDNSSVLEELRSYRPQTSVFDMQGLGRNASQGKRDRDEKTVSDDEQSYKRVKSKRKAHPIRSDGDIKLSHYPQADNEERMEQEEKHRALRQSGVSEVEAAVMDLVPDDARDILRKRNIVKWDRKRKRYVQQDGEVKPRRMVRNEAGVMVMEDRQKKTGTYEMWKKRHHGGIQPDAKNTVMNAPDYRSRWRTTKPESHGVKDELRRPEQIAKERRQKQKTAARHTRGKAKRMNKKH